MGVIADGTTRVTYPRRFHRRRLAAFVLRRTPLSASRYSVACGAGRRRGMARSSSTCCGPPQLCVRRGLPGEPKTPSRTPTSPYRAHARGS